MEIESRQRLAIEAVRAAEFMTAIAMLVSALLRDWDLMSIFALAFGAITYGRQKISTIHAKPSRQRSISAQSRKITIGIAVIGAILLRIVSVIEPTFMPVAYFHDYITFGLPPGDGWILASTSDRYRGYLRAESVTRKRDAVGFMFRLSIRRAARTNGVAYILGQANADCVTRSFLTLDEVAGFASTGKRLAVFTPASAMSLANRRGALSILVDVACARK